MVFSLPVIWRGWVVQWGPQLGLYIISPYFGYNCRVFAAHHYQLSPSQDSAVELLNFDIDTAEILSEIEASCLYIEIAKLVKKILTNSWILSTANQWKSYWFHVQMS